jgi:deoxyhypusine synthase
MKVNHFKPGKRTVNEFTKELKNVGFQGKKLSRAVDIAEDMIKDSETKVFLGIAGALVPGGMRELLIDMVGKVDVIVTTGANMTHDLIEALGHSHYHCSEKVDDLEMKKEGKDRMYNVYMKNDVYEDLENFINDNWDKIKTCKSSEELLWKLGELAPNNCILKECFEKKVPIFCPALADSGIGLMIWNKVANGDEKIEVGMFEDLKEIMDITWTSKKNGVIYLGGGVPKNFIQQALQLANDASFGVQISMDQASWGGSSGAPLREGISWGKMKETAKFVDLKCDVSIALPIIHSALMERLN